jgi:hypothetical protein
LISAPKKYIISKTLYSRLKTPVFAVLLRRFFKTAAAIRQKTLLTAAKIFRKLRKFRVFNVSGFTFIKKIAGAIFRRIVFEKFRD